MKNKLNKEDIIYHSEKVKKHVMFEFNINIDSTSRKIEYIDARSIYYKILYNFYLFTYEEIATVANKNHSSIINSISNFEYYIEQNKTKKERYLKVLLSLGLISLEEKDYMQLSEEKSSYYKIHKLVKDIPENKVDFFYEKIKILLNNC